MNSLKTKSVDDLSERERDALLAQHVFGLQVEPRRNRVTGKLDFVYAQRSWGDVLVPEYTVGRDRPYAVSYALEQRGWKRTEAADVARRDHGDVRVVFEHADARRVEATGWVNEALCRAALKAVLSGRGES